MIEKNTLYYVFSTDAQVIGALVAILAAFIHFRITRLQDYLIGDGQAILNRWAEYQKNWEPKFNNESFLYKRLEDGIVRKNVYEIKDALKHVSELEKKRGQIKERNNLIYVIKEWFGGTEKKVKELKDLTVLVVVLAIFTIILSIVSLSIVDILANCEYCAIMSLLINLFFTIVTLLVAGFVIYQGFMDKAIHEKDTDNPIVL